MWRANSVIEKSLIREEPEDINRHFEMAAYNGQHADSAKQYI